MANDTNLNIEALETGVLNGDRRLLAQAITLVESAREDHQKVNQSVILGD